MKINTSKRYINRDALASHFVKYLQDNQTALSLEISDVYFEYPLYKDYEGNLIISQVLLVSLKHGVIPISITDLRDLDKKESGLKEVDSNLEGIFDHIYSRLIRNKKLKSGRKQLAFEVTPIIFAPNISGKHIGIEISCELITSYSELHSHLDEIKSSTIDETLYNEIISTIDGAKALARTKARTAPTSGSKGNIANKLEAEILLFDQSQRFGYMIPVDGMQRIRGLAGSGKTVILAMKAALTHLRYPDAKILYTFYTKSLYQMIQGLITRFYRQYDDALPNFDQIHILHAWGGRNTPGVYYNACINNDIQPITYSTACQFSNNPFDYICSQLLGDTNLTQKYDYIFIDEGQDFPASFIKLCTKLAKNNKIVWAYDDLQTIFQAATPSQAEIVGTDAAGNPAIELVEDIVLHKCYRNPREILVCAHALGFGIYGNRIVQMLESKEHWHDVGYRHIQGDFVEGQQVIIERPQENSLKTISESQEKENIISAHTFDAYSDEIQFVIDGIFKDIQEGLRPDDILVIAMDDRNAKTYLNDIGTILSSNGIRSNNIHLDSYGIMSFEKDGYITLSTVHKAKGNEAYSVYVTGIDAIFNTVPSVNQRNKVFTALTRAKGWVKISGIAPAATIFKNELQKALDNFPYLKFTYPSPQQLKIMKRDLKARDIKKLEAERLLDQVLAEMSPEEVQDFMQRKLIKKSLKK